MGKAPVHISEILPEAIAGLCGGEFFIWRLSTLLAARKEEEIEAERKAKKQIPDIQQV
ncbi:MAG: hypothetical protein AAB358_03850 [Patescibacteria group bacterium]